MTKPPTVRQAVDLRQNLVHSVRAQGMRPTCLAFSFSGAHESARYIASGVTEEMAQESLWWRCVSDGLTTGDGAQLQDIANALVTTGQPSQAEWPYNANLGAGTENPPVGCRPQPWAKSTWRPLNIAADGVEDEIEDELGSGLPVVLVIEVTSEFFSPDVEGYVAIPSLLSPPGGYHAVLIVGAATDAVRGRNLLVRNSWGPGWGLSGYGWLPLDYLTNFAVQAAVVD